MANSEAKVLVGPRGPRATCAAAARRRGRPRPRARASRSVRSTDFRPFTDLNRVARGPLPPRSPGMEMMYTSGTTGQPKGVRRPLARGRSRRRRRARRPRRPARASASPSTTACTSCAVRCTTPVRSSASPMRCTPGHTVVIMRQWTPEPFLELVERHRVTNTQMVPTMFVRLLALPDERAGAGRRVVAREHLPHRRAVPGRREAADDGVVRSGRLRDLRRHRGRGDHRDPAPVAGRSPAPSAGPIVGAVVKILDDDGHELPAGRSPVRSTSAPRARTDGRVLQGRREVGVDPARVAGHPRRRRLLRRRRLPLPVRPQDRHGHHRRREHLPGRGRSLPPRARRGRRRRRDRRARRRMGRVGEGHRGAERRRRTPDAELADALVEHCRERIARFKCPRTGRLRRRCCRACPNGKVEKRRLREPYWAGRDRAI